MAPRKAKSKVVAATEIVKNDEQSNVTQENDENNVKEIKRRSTKKSSVAKKKKSSNQPIVVSEEDDDENDLEKDNLVDEDKNDANNGEESKRAGKGKTGRSTSRASTKKRGRKRSSSGSSDRSESRKKAKKSPAKNSRAKIPDISHLKFDNDSKSATGKKWNVKISSWNINGVRAWLEKNGQSFIMKEDPDVFCVQETKCSDDKIPEEIKDFEGYHCYWLSGDKDGYSGVGLMAKKKPKNVQYGIGKKEHDKEGRVITAEFDKFYVVNTYVPNAGRGLVRLDYRMKWDKDFRKYIKSLDEKKRVILCGDMNVAHEAIDLANPKTNKRNAGFTQEERDGFSELLDEGFLDSFRHLYPDVTGAYTFWTYMMNARAKNVGWRLDYFVLSNRLQKKLCNSLIRKKVVGSDHCPITLLLAF